MLVTLRQIMSQVRAAPTLDDALAVIIQQVKKAVRIDACAVYLPDRERDDWETWQCLSAVREPRKREALPSKV